MNFVENSHLLDFVFVLTVYGTVTGFILANLIKTMLLNTFTFSSVENTAKQKVISKLL